MLRNPLERQAANRYAALFRRTAERFSAKKINLRTMKQILTFDVSNVKRQYDYFVCREVDSKNLGRRMG